MLPRPYLFVFVFAGFSLSLLVFKLLFCDRCWLPAVLRLQHRRGHAARHSECVNESTIT